MPTNSIGEISSTDDSFERSIDVLIITIVKCYKVPFDNIDHGVMKHHSIRSYKEKITTFSIILDFLSVLHKHQHGKFILRA